VVVTESSNEPGQLLSDHICSVLGLVARIVNVVVLIANQFANRSLHALNNTNASADRLNLHTWFPFKLGECGEVQDVNPFHEWVFNNNGRFSHNANFTLQNFQTISLVVPLN